LAGIEPYALFSRIEAPVTRFAASASRAFSHHPATSNVGGRRRRRRSRRMRRRPTGMRS
jgi:hypothetical protein